MNLMLPIPFVPTPDSDAVQRLRKELRAEKPPVRIRVITEYGARERNCYVEVRDKVEREGGKMQLGWAVWQHVDLFIEAEPHAVFDPGEGKPWIDCTPHRFPDGRMCREILFIPNDGGAYDFNTTDVPDNIRLPLVDDPRVSEALRLFSERTALINSVPGIDVPLPPTVRRKKAELELRAMMLLSSAVRPPITAQPGQRIGRNDPCPCGSGKKYKKCHGV
jgi:hypothetical protein